MMGDNDDMCQNVCSSEFMKSIYEPTCTMPLFHSYPIKCNFICI